jgi:DNA modification methylase
MTDWTNSIQTGDCFDVLEGLPAESVHAVVTDPPYFLGDSGFMSRDWDDFSDSRQYQEWCREWAGLCRQVLKPGGHLLAFGGNTRHHRLFSGVEDAGYEVRDTLTWHYGSGFPKALDVSKAIDKQADAEREVVGTKEGQPGYSDTENTGQIRPTEHAGGYDSYLDETAPATDAAERWDGFKTALKPATEFVVLARKPLGEGTVAENVQEWGTGALNVDGCRVETDGNRPDRGGENNGSDSVFGQVQGSNYATGTTTKGRYPSNVVFDQQAAEQLDREVGELGVSRGGSDASPFENGGMYANEHERDYDATPGKGDSGGPSRYFYTSKATKAERTLDGRIENAHPTVKPHDLMEWLVRLVTAEGQTVLDPFAGSGTTCKAAKDLGREFIGIEKQPKWADVARVRVGLTPEDPARVRDDDDQQGLEAFADGGESDG